MRFFFALVIARILRFAGGFVGRSTNLPGSVALKLCPDLFRHFSFDGKIIAVSGSNGKTTTTNLIAHILRRQGYRVALNKEGSNMDAGIATTLICACRANGRVPHDFVVLETDERYSAVIYKDIAPDFFVLTNLFRDQVVRNGNPDVVFAKLSEAIRTPKTEMILNGNDPLSQRLAPDNKRVYFGMERTSRSTDQNEFLTQDCKVCPKCFHRMDYRYYHYNHIGDFCCSSCGYHTPECRYLVTDVDFEKGSFKVAGTPVTVGYHATFHILNTAAAIAVCHEAGVPLQAAAEAAGTFEVSKVRYDEMTVLGRRAVLLLTKQNPTSLDQSISYALEQPGEKSVVLFVNNVLYTDKKDISWLYDVTFERLRGKVDKVVCSGSRAYDIAVRLKQGGFTESEMEVTDRLDGIKAAVGRTRGTIYILAASAFGNEDGILEALK